MYVKISVFILILCIAYMYMWPRGQFDQAVLKGKVVVVTGASAGIGEQIAYHYARMGASVMLTARRKDRLKEVVMKCAELSRQYGHGSTAGFSYHPADMEDVENAEQVIQATVKAFRKLDILVLNHVLPIGVTEWSGSAENITLHERIFKVNFFSYVRLASAAMPFLEESGGSLIVMSSVAGKVNFPYLAPYASTKFALNGFFGNIQKELHLRQSPMSLTLCTIGLVSTENAMHHFRRSKLAKHEALISIVTPYDTALAVVKSGAMREEELFYPYFTSKFATLFPGMVSAIESTVSQILG